MGAECPYGHGRQNIVSNLTADQTPPKRASDVIAVRLACGCVVGGEKYEEFRAELMKVQAEENAAIQAARKASASKKAAAFRVYVMESDKHAE